jgi:hypothetical protein
MICKYSYGNKQEGTVLRNFLLKCGRNCVYKLFEVKTSIKTDSIKLQLSKLHMVICKYANL